MVRFAQLMYRNAQSQVRENSSFGDNSLVQIDWSQVSEFCVLLIIIVMEALSREMTSGCPKR